MMNNRILSSIVAIIALSTGIASAQEQTAAGNTGVVENSQDFTVFDGFEANDSFRIVYEKSDSYSVSWKTNANLADYVEIYIKERILHIEFNRKGLPYEISRMYRAKNAPEVVLDVVVSAPGLSSVKIGGNVALRGGDDTLAADSLHVTVAGNADFNDLAINARNVAIEASGKADVSVPVTARQVTLTSSNTSTLNASVDCSALTVIDRNSATMNIRGKAENVTVNGLGREVDILSLDVPKAELILANGCRVYAAPKVLMSLDMKGGSLASFSGDPAIEIVNIQNSSVQRFTGEKK